MQRRKTLHKYYPDILKSRYNVVELDEDFIEVYEIIGKKIGAIISGGEVDYNRVSDYILNDIKNEYIKQIFWGVSGIVLIFVVSLIDYRKLRRIIPWLFVALILVLI